MIKTFEDYKKHFEKYGKCIDQAFPSKNKINERTLKKKYENYINKNLCKKTTFKVDEKWVKVREEVFKRDGGECRLLKLLPREEVIELKNNSGGLHNIIDPAHILNKSTYRELYYEKDNIICLNRFSHSMLDFNKHPIKGVAITKKEVEKWWSFIIGKEELNRLKNIVKGKRGIN